MTTMKLSIKFLCLASLLTVRRVHARQPFSHSANTRFAKKKTSLPPSIFRSKSSTNNINTIIDLPRGGDQYTDSNLPATFLKLGTRTLIGSVVLFGIFWLSDRISAIFKERLLKLVASNIVGSSKTASKVPTDNTNYDMDPFKLSGDQDWYFNLAKQSLPDPLIISNGENVYSTKLYYFHTANPSLLDPVRIADDEDW
jgi:hypothetical protein